MPQPDDRRLEYRHTGAWWTLAVGVTALVCGIVVAHGLLIAAGLVFIGIGVQLFDAER